MSQLSRNFIAANNLVKLTHRLQFKTKAMGFNQIMCSSNNHKLKELSVQTKSKNSDVLKIEELQKKVTILKD